MVFWFGQYNSSLWTSPPLYITLISSLRKSSFFRHMTSNRPLTSIFSPLFAWRSSSLPGLSLVLTFHAPIFYFLAAGLTTGDGLRHPASSPAVCGSDGLSPSTRTGSVTPTAVNTHSIAKWSNPDEGNFTSVLYISWRTFHTNFLDFFF